MGNKLETEELEAQKGKTIDKNEGKPNKEPDQKGPETSTADLQETLGKLEAAQKLIEKHPKETKEVERLIVEAILVLYRLPMMRKAEIFWNNRSDTTQNLMLGNGIGGKAIGTVVPMSQAMQTFAVALVNAGVLEAPEGMDLEKNAERSKTILHAIDKTSPLWSQLVLIFGPEAEAAVPMIVSIVKTLTFLNDNYQDVMKNSRQAVAKERTEIQQSLDTVEKLHAEPTGFVQGETHGMIEEDLKIA